MRYWAKVLGLAVVVVLLVTCLAVACGGEDQEGEVAEGTPAGADEATPEELSLEEYFRQMEAIGEDVQTGVAALEEEGLGQEIEATQDYIYGFEAIVQQAVNDVNDLDPPAEAQADHDKFAAALSGLQAVLEDLSNRVTDVESPSNLSGLLAEIAPVGERFEDACLELEAIADENGIEVDLHCE
jgi:hypothetical protein